MRALFSCCCWTAFLPGGLQEVPTTLSPKPWVSVGSGSECLWVPTPGAVLQVQLAVQRARFEVEAHPGAPRSPIPGQITARSPLRPRFPSAAWRRRGSVAAPGRIDAGVPPPPPGIAGRRRRGGPRPGPAVADGRTAAGRCSPQRRWDRPCPEPPGWSAAPGRCGVGAEGSWKSWSPRPVPAPAAHTHREEEKPPPPHRGAWSPPPRRAGPARPHGEEGEEPPRSSRSRRGGEMGPSPGPARPLCPAPPGPALPPSPPAERFQRPSSPRRFLL